MNSVVKTLRGENNFIVDPNYDIPEELQVKTENKKFLFFDSGINDINRVLIFTTEENLTHIEYSDVLICDGTFRSSPSCFEQIFTIQCRLRDMFLLMMFCFIKRKNEFSYNAIFNFIK
ncbi:hypothetical protein DMUE_1474 [Dictyocoela muelleri]|nr:hypothetical protein DMUE_1474 [Dictyocoela muelleri]